MSDATTFTKEEIWSEVENMDPDAQMLIVAGTADDWDYRIIHVPDFTTCQVCGAFAAIEFCAACGCCQLKEEGKRK